MWMPLLGPLPKPAWFGNGAKLIYLLAVRFAGAALANVLAWAGSPLYPDYAEGEAEWDITPLGVGSSSTQGAPRGQLPRGEAGNWRSGSSARARHRRDQADLAPGG